MYNTLDCPNLWHEKKSSGISPFLDFFLINRAVLSQSQGPVPWASQNILSSFSGGRQRRGLPIEGKKAFFAALSHEAAWKEMVF